MVYTNAWTIGKQRRVVKELESQTVDLPPPGNYGAPHKVSDKQAPKWSLSKDPKGKTLSDGHPGPLEYEIPSKVDEGPKFSMGGKTVYNRNPLLTGTGPGDYDPDKAFRKTSTSFKENLHVSIAGKSKDPTDLRMPGPGYYEHENKKKFIPGAGLGKAIRAKSSRKSHDSPGPGNYTVEKFAKDNAGPKFGFGSSKKDKIPGDQSLSPGPGYYNEKKVMTDGAPGYSIKGRRPDWRVLPGKDVPGPGSYEPSHRFTKKAGPQYGVGKGSKSKIANIYTNTPAPNWYKPQSNFIK